MLTRSAGGVLQNTFVYDNENRLTRILLGDGLNYIGDYAYNGQGERVYAHTDGDRILYPNPYVEFRLNGVGPGGWMTKYYYMGNRRLAVKDGDKLG